MAGPWFTVQEEKDGWQTLDRIWLSNGKKNGIGRIQLKIRLDEPASEKSSEEDQ